jgi:hypothetical protein
MNHWCPFHRRSPFFRRIAFDCLEPAKPPMNYILHIRDFANIDWKSLIDSAPQYGFLGGIVGIVGLVLSATTAILYGFTRAFDDWKPDADSPLAGLDKMIGALVAIGVVALWLFATPENIVSYIELAFWLMGGAVIAFIIYVGLRVMCTCPKPITNDNQPAGQKRIWGGFWLTSAAKARPAGDSVCKFLAGNRFDKDLVWPTGSQATVAMLTAVILLIIVAGGGAGLSAAATTVQVALTKKPARDVLSSSAVRGLPPPKSSPSEKKSN